MTEQDSTRVKQRWKGYAASGLNAVMQVYIRITMPVLLIWVLVLAFLGIDAVAYATNDSATAFSLSEWSNTLHPVVADAFTYLTLWMFGFFVFGALILGLTDSVGDGESNAE